MYLTHSQETKIVTCKNLCISFFWGGRKFYHSGKEFCNLKGNVEGEAIALSGYAKNRFHVIRPPTAIRTTSKVKLLRLYVRASFLCRILVNYIRLFLDMVGTKHCSGGRCNMDSRYPDRMPQSLKELQEWGQKVFIPFVKPWHDLERCKKWVNACSRKNFTTESITKNSYICALH